MTNKNLIRIAGKLIVPLGLLAILLSVVGAEWDAWFHVKYEHTLLSAPHLVVIAGLIAFTICGMLAFFILLEDKALLRGEKRAMWLVAAGGLITPLTLAFDELWHRMIGLDMTTWSAPHAIMFAAVASVLIGLAVFSLKSRTLPTLFFATVILLGLFSLADFDMPQMSWLKDIRPGFAYPLAATGISTFLFLTMTLVVKKVGTATLAATLAWSTHFAIGYSVDAIGGFTHTLPPFPIIIPALALDMALILSKNTNFRRGFKTLIPLSFFIATITYWSAIAWSVLYASAQAPQQISGNAQDWFLWYLAFIPAASLLLAWLAQRFANWFTPHTM